MAIRSTISRQGSAATRRPVRIAETMSTPVMRRETPQPVKKSSPSPSIGTEAPSVMPSELFNSDGTASPAKEEAPASVSNIDPAVSEATMPDFGGLAQGRLASGVKTGVMARAAGAPAGEALKYGVQSAFNPTGVMLAMADDVVPGMISRGRTQENFDDAISDVDPTGSRGVRETMNAVAENRGTRRVDEKNLDALRSIGFDDYVSVDRELQQGRMASRPFTSQLKDTVSDPLEKGFKSMFGISEKEDLDRMIADDPAAAAVMRGHTYTKPMDEMAYSNRVKAPTAISPQQGVGQDFGGRDGGGRASGGRGMSDAGGFGTGEKGDREGQGWV